LPLALVLAYRGRAHAWPWAGRAGGRQALAVSVGKFGFGSS